MIVIVMSLLSKSSVVTVPLEKCKPLNGRTIGVLALIKLSDRA